MLIEAVVEETLTEVINSGHEAITRLVVGVGRGSVASAAVRIYRSMRNQGLTLAQIELQQIKVTVTMKIIQSYFSERMN